AQPPRANAPRMEPNNVRRDMASLRETGSLLSLFDHTARMEIANGPRKYADSFRRRFGKGIAQLQVVHCERPQRLRRRRQQQGTAMIKVARAFAGTADDARPRQSALQAQLRGGQRVARFVARAQRCEQCTESQ